MKNIRTTDLLYAAFLLSIGAELDKIEDCGRYSSVVLTLPDSSMQNAKNKTARLNRICDRSETTEELEYIYSHSLLSDVSMHYYKLKKQIMRSKNDSRANK